jgi:hypothetical protein
MQAELFDGGNGLKPLGRQHVMFAGQPVGRPLVDDAVKALAYFCERTGRRVRPFTARGQASDSLRRIIGAMVSYPETRILAKRMVDVALADQWWKGVPTVGVVFGPGVVERHIDAARRRRPERSSATDQARAILDVARRPRVPLELAAEVLRSEGHGEAAERVDRDGLGEAAKWAWHTA